ncbi:MAG: rRNA pseudouridine synthase [Synergistaceae bacterium]|jgi:23S rRNA pseudouridine2605 synthase|nr:rRNA pseudouridine synthase [Synergistaceae bacterium]
MSSGREEFPMRLNRYIALCGEASRRKAEALISSGLVTVDGLVERALGRVLSGGEDVRVDGRAIGVTRSVYMALNKPRGILSAVSDEHGATALDLLPEFYRNLGLYPVGRLDKDSEGLILMTNDGKFAQSVIHPSSCVKKTYVVFLRYVLDRKQMMEWSSGVIIDGKLAVPLEIAPEDGYGEGKCFRIVLAEGFKREIRLMAEAVGNKVDRLLRIGIGRMFLKYLPAGSFREYNYTELWNMISNGGEV